MADEEPVRLAEVLAALSLATDLGMGQPLGHAIRCCVIATGLAEQLRLPTRVRSDVFYVGLLRYIGCTADAFEVAQVAGDEVALAVAVAPFVMGDPAQEQLAVGPGDLADVKAAAMRAHCEAGGLLATRLGLGEGAVAALRHGFERWDGTGHPAGLVGPAIPEPTRIAVLARDVELWARRGGYAAAAEVARSRRGKAYDPAVVDAFCAVGESLLQAADAGWQAMLAVEPVPTVVPAHRLDGMLEVLADFADAKLPTALGHSRSVARLAEAATREVGAGPATATRARRAGLVQDVGRVAVSNRVWETPGPLSWEARERVRLHPYLSEQVLLRSPPLRPLAALAGAHHERMDGSGYYRGVDARELTVLHQILAAADVYAAMRQSRPHRPARTPAEAADELAAEAHAGRLHQRAVSAVLAAAGAPASVRPPHWPAGLTDREVDVLRLACRGATNQAVAAQLRISAKTVGRHLENSYAKIGVSSRAAAALFAVDQGLL